MNPKYRIVPAYGYGANLERWNGLRWVFVLTGTGGQCAQAKQEMELADARAVLAYVEEGLG